MTGKRIVITGAASGIGEAALAELKRRGARVLGLDLVAQQPEMIACDVRDQESVDRAVAEAIERLGGGLDVLINCAGLATPQSAGLAPDARALAVIDVNMVGPWRMASAALPALRAARGRVVNVASGMAFVAQPFAAAYAMSKHGVVAYSQALRLEHGDAISVTTVYPGYIRTPIHKDSEDFGLTLEGSSPEESLEDAVSAIVRGALDDPPARDIITTRTGKVTVALTRHLPGTLVDRLVLRAARNGLKKQSLTNASPPLIEFADRLAGRTRTP